MLSCIPVLFDDHDQAFPFEKDLDYDAMVVRIPSNRVAECILFSIISEHADGECRGPVSVRRDRRKRPSETFPMLPSDLI